MRVQPPHVNFAQSGIRFFLLIETIIGPVSCKDMQTSTLLPPLPFSEVAIFTWKMRTVLKRMNNKCSNFYFSSYDWLYLQFYGDTSDFSSVSPTKKKTSFKSGQIYRKGAECAEANEKSIFLFLVLVDFVLKIHWK